jgi:hypothetical protein
METASLRFSGHPRNHPANKNIAFIFLNYGEMHKKKGHLSKPGSVYGLEALAVVLFHTRDAQMEVRKLSDSIPGDWRKQESFNMGMERNAKFIIVHKHTESSNGRS